MSVCRFLPITVGMVLLGLQVCAHASQPVPGDPPRLHAAVYMVRGSVSGSNVGTFGPFVLEEDSAWRRLSLSNVISCGIAMDRAGTGKRLYLAAGNGVHRSTDGGSTWRILTGWRTMEILTVLPDKRDSSTIYAATPWGVYKSQDDGRTWNERSTGFRHWYVKHIGFDARSAVRLYATAEDDLYVSDDGAEHWRPMGVGGGSVLAFFQHPVNPMVIVASTEDRGIFRSTNRGETWVPATGPSLSSIYAFAGSPDGRTLYAAGWETGIWQSKDAGATWDTLWNSSEIQAIFCLLVDPRNPDLVYAGTDGNGVFASTDRGATWRCIGLQGGKVKQLMFYP